MNLTFDRPVAHRGLHDRTAGIIENSAAAFRAAIEAGFAIECDLQLTADGRPIVFHDDDRERLTGRTGAVADTSFEEMSSIPLLDSAAGDCPMQFADFLALVDGRALLQVELKHQRDEEGTDRLARAAAECLADYTGPVTVESFDPRLLVLVRKHGFSGPLGIITYDYDPEGHHSTLGEEQRFILKNLLHWHETRFDFISCAKNALDLPAIRFWRELGVPVTAWTIKSQAEADAVASACDQIVFEGFDPRD
ncbi:phosphodiesterase [Devosia pacifica]|uniref:Phosphodiesterase n=1 Tax=Devosia pacifica TaxID=1335967 RepID=A0A918VP18_9HYPH|nr:glycerophosphodiester phosphodiesterase family protein [Devosia pacifica]GHA12558.1 phosphodiesterase [Devosia pacifica]